jgi:hypothetical protein
VSLAVLMPRGSLFSCSLPHFDRQIPMFRFVFIPVALCALCLGMVATSRAADKDEECAKCLPCAESCTKCAAMCKADFPECAKLCTACANLCRACDALKGTNLGKEVKAACQKLCLKCAESCEKTGKASCKACAVVCRDCATCCKPG